MLVFSLFFFYHSTKVCLTTYHQNVQEKKPKANGAFNLKIKVFVKKVLHTFNYLIYNRFYKFYSNFLFHYKELTKRELEYVSLSRDTTESDLKQRREIENGTASYIDQVKQKSNTSV